MFKSATHYYSLAILFLVACSTPDKGKSDLLQSKLAPEKAWKSTAMAGLKTFMGLIPPGDCKQYGFDSPEQIAQAELGHSTGIYTLGSKQDPNDSAQSMLITVQVDNQAKGLLRMEKSDTGWVVVGYSGADLSRQLALAAQVNPALANAPMVRIPWQSQDFLIQKDGTGYLAYPVMGDPTFSHPQHWTQLPSPPKNLGN